MAREPKVLTFDVVGTLIDFEKGMLDYLRAACGPAAAAHDDDTLLAHYRRTRGNAKPKRFPDDLERVYHEISGPLGLPQSDAIARGFTQSIKDWPAFPDSVDALKRLAKRYKLVAMTNAQRWSLDHMEKTLGSPFHDSVTVDEALVEKPNPLYFAFARGRLSRDGVNRPDILHVAQSQYHDIGVARQLGYTVCWIERRQGLKGTGGTLEAEFTKPDYHFATLAQLADLAESGGLVMKTDD
ncbi:HAD-IA family hydrolase [Roseomonas sp. USHLN139]|uniref:HAD-IA family hydrolase n=1 Tax=Roseomonas sp. USHLN139 TaxID=3081298 RepID=UPI003B011E5B